MTILDDPNERANWLQYAKVIGRMLLRMETALSAAMASHPKQSTATLLGEADTQLGEAARSVQEAAAKVRQIP